MGKSRGTGLRTTAPVVWHFCEHEHSTPYIKHSTMGIFNLNCHFQSMAGNIMRGLHHNQFTNCHNIFHTHNWPQHAVMCIISSKSSCIFLCRDKRGLDSSSMTQFRACAAWQREKIGAEFKLLQLP